MSNTAYVPLDNLAEPKSGFQKQTAQTSAVTVCLLIVVCVGTVGGLVGYMYENPLPVTYNDRQYRVEWSGKQTGRLLLMFSTSNATEPRYSIGLTQRNPYSGDHQYFDSQYIFGVDVVNSDYVLVNESSIGFPVDNLGLLPSGNYYVQGLLNVYTLFRRSDGYNVSLHMDRGEGQQWNLAPGNLYSNAAWTEITRGQRVTFRLTQTIPPITPPSDTDWVKYVTIESERLSEFWGTKITLGAQLLLPLGYDNETLNASYPLVIYHGHFSQEWATPVPFRPELPTATPGTYAYTVQDYAHRLYLDWTNTTEGSPFYGRRVIILCIQHANPYYDDSYAVNSPNVGPYATAIETELIPYLESNFRILPVDQDGRGWARVVYGGSTGGWEALAVQVFNPDFYNGAWVNCPDPVDFHAFELINLYLDTQAYSFPANRRQTIRSSIRDPSGNIWSALREEVQLERVLGSPGSGQQWDIWTAVYSPVNTSSGYPSELFDKNTGQINPDIATYWIENWDLTRYLALMWPDIGNKLIGKLHFNVGTMDNYYLNLAVQNLEQTLSNTNPESGATFNYGNGFDHCYSGDPTVPTAISRLTINQRFLPEMAEWLIATAPDTGKSLDWTRY